MRGFSSNWLNFGSFNHGMSIASELRTSHRVDRWAARVFAADLPF